MIIPVAIHAKDGIPTFERLIVSLDPIKRVRMEVARETARAQLEHRDFCKLEAKPQ